MIYSYYDRSHKCVYLIAGSVTEMVFYNVPQTVVHESLAVDINLSGVIVDKNNTSNNIFICGNKSGKKICSGSFQCSSGMDVCVCVCVCVHIFHNIILLRS
jgi:hypothetical protein